MMGSMVVVVGSINVDLVVTVERLPRPGETVSDGTFARFGGGKGANQAVAAARAGALVQMVGLVGDDDEGRSALDQLQREGVVTDGVVATDLAATGVALIVVDAAGRNQISVAPGANRLLDRFPKDVLAGDSGGVLLLSFETPDAVLCDAAEAARARGWTVIVNPAPARALPARLLACAPMLVPNEYEAADLTDTTDPEQAAVLLAAMTGAPVIVTLGSAGALLLEAELATLISAPAVDAVDTTGAGDCLCGTLAARIAAGDALADALRMAVKAASRSTLTPGARASF